MNQENEFRVRLRAAAASANARLGTSFSVNADRAGAYLEIANVLRDGAQRTGNDQYRQAAIRIEEQAEITRGKIYVYSPPVGKSKGRVIPLDTGPKQHGLREAKERLAQLEGGK